MALTLAHLNLRRDIHAAVAAPPPPGTYCTAANADKSPRPRIRIRAWLQGTDTCTPAPTPRTRVGTSGAHQAVARVQLVSPTPEHRARNARASAHASLRPDIAQRPPACRTTTHRLGPPGERGVGSHAPAKLIAHLRGNRTSPERYTHTYRSHPSSAGLHALAAGKRAPRAAGDHIHTSAACLCIGGLVCASNGTQRPPQSARLDPAAEEGQSPASNQAGSHAQFASQSRTGRTQGWTHTYIPQPRTPLRSHPHIRTSADKQTQSSSPPPPPWYSRGIPANAGKEPMPMHTDPSVAQGNNPRAICIVTPAPTPRTQAAATGATQGAPRTQQASAPRPKDCARPCLCIAAPKHLSALTGTPLQNAQRRAGTTSGPYRFAHQRQRHTHEQVPPGQLREQLGPSGLLRPRPQYCARPCSCIAVPRHLAALTGTPLQDAQGRADNPGAKHICTPAPTPRTRAGANGATQGVARTQRASAPRPQDCARPCSCIAVPRYVAPLTGTSLQSAQGRARTIPGPNTYAHRRQRHAHE